MLKINKKLKRIKENFCFEMIVMVIIDIMVSYTFFNVVPLWVALLIFAVIQLVTASVINEIIRILER